MGAAALLVTGCSDSSTPTTPDPGPGSTTSTVSFPVSQDTYVRSASPTSSYGTFSFLDVGAGSEAYLRFSLADLPEEAVVRSVSLAVTASSSDTSSQVTVYEITDDTWSESVTYDDRPASGDAIGSFSVQGPIDENTSVTFSPSALADFCKRESIASNRVVSFRLTATEAVRLRAAEYNGAEVQPRLEVTYEMGTRVRLEPVADVSVTDGVSTPDGDREELLVNTDISHTFLRFDLRSSVPSGAQVHGTTLTAIAYTGYAYGGDGNVYTLYVPEDGWDESTMIWDDQPATSGESIGHWWLWYGGTPVDQTARNRSDALVDRTQQEVDGDRVLSLRLHSPGYRTTYRSREYGFESQRPSLEVLFTP